MYGYSCPFRFPKNRPFYPCFWGELVVFHPITPITIEPQREVYSEPGLTLVRIFARGPIASHLSDFIRVFFTQPSWRFMSWSTA